MQNIGEAARGLPPDVLAKAPDIPWSKIMGMRHILVHDYFNIDTDLVWDVVERDLPDLKRKVQVILREQG